MTRMILTVTSILCFVAAAAILLGVLFLVPTKEERTVEVWIPQQGIEGDVFDIVFAHDGRNVHSLDEIHEITLKEFQARNYSTIHYGVWVDGRPYVYYWAHDSDYPNGVWTRTIIGSKWGQKWEITPKSIVYRRLEYEQQQLHRAYPLVLFDDNSVTVGFTRDMMDGWTPVPALGPVPLAALITVMGLLLFVMWGFTPLAEEKS